MAVDSDFRIEGEGVNVQNVFSVGGTIEIDATYDPVTQIRAVEGQQPVVLDTESLPPQDLNWDFSPPPEGFGELMLEMQNWRLRDILVPIRVKRFVQRILGNHEVAA